MMDSSDQSPRPPEETAVPNSVPPADQTVVAPPGTYPPPAYPAPYFPPTVAMAATPATPAEPAGGRMPRAQALDMLSRLKTTLVAGSVLAFGMFAALAASHITGITSRGGSSTQSTNGAQNSQSDPAATATPSDDGNFFNTGPASGFGVGAPGPQGPASSTSVS